MLTVLTTIGQALNTAAQDTEQTLTAAAQSVSETLTKTLNSASSAITSTASTAAATFTSPPWQSGQTTTTDQYVQSALSEISAAQSAISTGTQGNLFSSIEAIVPEIELSVAATELNAWQSGNASALQFYEQNYNNLLLGGVAQLVLNFNESLPGMAVSALNAAESTTSSMGLTTASSDIAQAAINGRVYGSVPLIMASGTEPIVYISVNGGKYVPVLVDTGSSGLVIGADNVGTASSLGTAIGTNTGAYAGGLTYNYTEYDTTVNFGNGIETGATAVDIVNSGADETAFENYLSGDSVVGVLGIGTNAVGPGPSIVTSALPGPLSEGVYINESTGQLQFGANPLPVRASVSGSPLVTDGQVSINGATPTALNLLIDSGGVNGTIPSTVISSVPSGTTISVYSGTTLLYTYTTTSSNSPTVTTDSGVDATQMNSGATPFLSNPIYIDYSTASGATDFDY
ncbi:PecA family PE domain-processing aspartic protease [Mycobacterium sp. OTB74]|uniref:PecA family PE domain-processing aspartic protease n=1 Tax=Mycobacterium sp. OTB74 TaxID=1853452 RepID=UPI002476C354|nr:PecA family PE domain-processing aspartic protease [Mycobacterium sp. OTB74]